MGNFKQDNKRSGGGFNRGSGGGKRFNSRDDGKPEMHKAVCGECGVNCEVPFRPTGKRPVLCSDCFKNQDGKSNKFDNKRRERSNFGDKQMQNAVCDKCGKNCQVPFKPTAGKPVFCDNCFKKDGSESKDFGEVVEQLSLLNDKIDKLIKMLTPKAKKEVVVKKVVKKKKGKTKVKDIGSKK